MKIGLEWWHKDDVINALNERDEEIESLKNQLDFIEQKTREQDHLVFNQQEEIDSLKKQLDEAVNFLKVALSFAPKGEVPKNLFPTSYFTLSYDEDVKLQHRVDQAREFLKRMKND